MCKFVLCEHRRARKHLVTDVTFLTSGRHDVRRLDVSFQLALRLERLCAVDALLTELVTSRRHPRSRSRQFVCGGGRQSRGPGLCCGCVVQYVGLRCNARDGGGGVLLILVRTAAITEERIFTLDWRQDSTQRFDTLG